MKIFTICVLLVSLSVVYGFAFEDITSVVASNIDDITGAFSAFDPNPSVAKMKESPLEGGKFSIKMDIGRQGETHLGISDMAIQLLKDEASYTMKLPGASGPHPKTSTGAFKMELLEPPSIITMRGKQAIEVEGQCWEMTWRKYRNCGTLCLGLVFTKGAERNGAILPAGRVYVSFPLWTQENLAAKQTERLLAEAKCKGYEDDMAECIKKMEQEPNIIKKLFHYRDAVEAAENVSYLGLNSMRETPFHKDIVPIGNGFILNNKGTVWRQGTSLFEGCDLIGTAELTALVDEKERLRP